MLRRLVFIYFPPIFLIITLCILRTKKVSRHTSIRLGRVSWLLRYISSAPIQKSISPFAICRATLALKSLCKILPKHAGRRDLAHKYPFEISDNYLLTGGWVIFAVPHLPGFIVYLWDLWKLHGMENPFVLPGYFLGKAKCEMRKALGLCIFHTNILHPADDVSFLEDHMACQECTAV